MHFYGQPGMTWPGSAKISPHWPGHQVGLQRHHPRIIAKCTLYKAVHCVYAASPWYAEDTMHVVYAVGHHLPCTPVQACGRLLHWL